MCNLLCGINLRIRATVDFLAVGHETLRVDRILSETALIEDSITELSPFPNKLLSKGWSANSCVTGVDLLSLFTTSAGLQCPNGITEDVVCLSNGYMAVLSTRRGEGSVLG